MHYRAFFFFQRSCESVSSASPIAMNAREIREQLLPRLQSDDDYIGLIDAGDNVLQLMCEPGGERFWLEIPLDAAKASYGCHVNREELGELIDSLPGVFGQTMIPGLKYRPW